MTESQSELEEIARASDWRTLEDFRYRALRIQRIFKDSSIDHELETVLKSIEVKQKELRDEIQANP